MFCRRVFKRLLNFEVWRCATSTNTPPPPPAVRSARKDKDARLSVKQCLSVSLPRTHTRTHSRHRHGSANENVQTRTYGNHGVEPILRRPSKNGIVRGAKVQVTTQLVHNCAHSASTVRKLEVKTDHNQRTTKQAGHTGIVNGIRHKRTNAFCHETHANVSDLSRNFPVYNIIRWSFHGSIITFTCICPSTGRILLNRPSSLVQLQQMISGIISLGCAFNFLV